MSLTYLAIKMTIEFGQAREYARGPMCVCVWTTPGVSFVCVIIFLTVSDLSRHTSLQCCILILGRQIDLKHVNCKQHLFPTRYKDEAEYIKQIFVLLKA